MTILLSSPNGFRILGWRKFGLALLTTWLLPAVIAAVALALQWILGTQGWGDGFLMLWALSVLMLFSPALSWLALLVATPLVLVLMNRGWFGWVPAVVLGMGFGGALGFIVGNEAMITFGAAQMAILRGLLARACPEAFSAPQELS